MWENESKYLFWRRVSKALGHGSHASLLVICSDIEYHAVPVCGRVGYSPHDSQTTWMSRVLGKDRTAKVIIYFQELYFSFHSSTISR